MKSSHEGKIIFADKQSQVCMHCKLKLELVWGNLQDWGEREWKEETDENCKQNTSEQNLVWEELQLPASSPSSPGETASIALSQLFWSLCIW